MSTQLQHVRVVVAEDHPLYLEGLSRAIGERPDIQLVGMAADGREALDLVRRLRPEVAVLDLHLPGLSGAEILNAIVRDALPTRVVVLSAEHDSAVVYDAIRGGAGAYLTKDASRRAICEAIVAVARGETVLGPEIQSGLVGELRRRDVDERPVLSPREAEMLRLIADGLSSPEIANRLYLSPATVKTHLQGLYGKLGVSERAAAVAEGMRRGLLE